MARNNFLLFVFLLIQSSLFAQYDLLWQKNIGGNGFDSARGIAIDTAGNILIAGTTYSYDIDSLVNLGSGDVFLSKLNPEGDIIWQKRYGGSNEDVAYSCLILEDGYVFASATQSSDLDVTANRGKYDIWLVKVDLDGNLIWEKSYGGTGTDFYPYLISTSDGGFLIVHYGDTSNPGWSSYGEWDVTLLKLDAEGNREWGKNYGGSGNDAGYTVFENANGEFIVGGSTGSNDNDVSFLHSQFDFWLLKVSATGQLLWEKTYGGGDGSNVLDEAILMKDGNFALGGTNGNNNAWIIKTNDAGELIWQKTLQGDSYDSINSIKESEDGGIIGVGLTSSQTIEGIQVGNNSITNMLVFELDKNGELLWLDSFGGSGREIGEGMISSGDGAYIVTATSTSDDGDFLIN